SDGRYAHADAWGERRWSTPAIAIDGRLACTQLSLLNAGLEELLDYSYRESRPAEADELITYDPNGNPISAFHPWNSKAKTGRASNPRAYSWGSSLTWRGHGFEVGAYARLYLTALAKKAQPSSFLAATGAGLRFVLPTTQGHTIELEWQVPTVWNTFERNRARAYGLAFSVAVTLENIAIAQQLVRTNETKTSVPLKNDRAGRHLGVGLWGASRGFLAHWAIITDHVIRNYQIAIPSRITWAPVRRRARSAHWRGR
ncbi:MAG: nickel-dependent hydrogenase large subunit, partial [Gammaproteobacteria bacterium]|nr:nickel-dependent hydrogenase large subunit [Gammaproteobacteria bacterium]